MKFQRVKASTGSYVGEPGPLPIHLQGFEQTEAGRAVLADLEHHLPPDTLSQLDLLDTQFITILEPMDITGVPEKVSSLQLNLALAELGLLDDVETAVAGADRDTQLYWTKTDPFERAHPKINDLAAAIGKTPFDVDNVFRLAATKG